MLYQQMFKYFQEEFREKWFFFFFTSCHYTAVGLPNLKPEVFFFFFLSHLLKINPQKIPLGVKIIDFFF